MARLTEIHLQQRLSFDLFRLEFLVGRCWSDRPPGEAGQYARLEPSAVLARTVRISKGAYRRFGALLRTVCP
jgi:hypothetical protein